MDWPWLILSHAAVGAACVVVTRRLVMRNVRVFEHDGHLALEVCPPDERDDLTDTSDRGAGRVGIVTLLASLVVIVLGVQMLVALRTDARDDQREARQDAADRAYADCLTTFAADLVDALQTRTEASAELEAARSDKDRLLDRLLELTQAATASGAESNDELPPGLLEEYRQVLRDRVTAQATFREAERELRKARRQNPLVAPEVTCTR